MAGETLGMLYCPALSSSMTALGGGDLVPQEMHANFNESTDMWMELRCTSWRSFAYDPFRLIRVSISSDTTQG